MSLRKFYLEVNTPVIEHKQEKRKISPYSVEYIGDLQDMRYAHMKFTEDALSRSLINREKARNRAVAKFLVPPVCSSPYERLGYDHHKFTARTKWFFFTEYKCVRCGAAHKTIKES